MLVTKLVVDYANFSWTETCVNQLLVMLISVDFCWTQLGVDEEGYIRVNSNWEGTVPEIYLSAYIFVEDHKEEYIRHRLG